MISETFILLLSGAALLSACVHLFVLFFINVRGTTNRIVFQVIPAIVMAGLFLLGGMGVLVTLGVPEAQSVMDMAAPLMAESPVDAR